jgi:hypothetical protein
MTDQDREFANRNAAREPGLQPDPMLHDGRASAGRKWAVTAVIVALLLAVMYGVTTHRADVKDEQRQSQMQNSPAANSTTPGQALPGGRTTADAPSTPAPKTSTRGPSQ